VRLGSSIKEKEKNAKRHRMNLIIFAPKWSQGQLEENNSAVLGCILSTCAATEKNVKSHV
jgi:hypothetical protein